MAASLASTASLVSPIAKWRAYTLLFILSTAQLLDIFSVTAPTIALPAISEATHIAHTDAEWIINAYSLTFGAFLLTAGRASELTGPRYLFVAGFTLVGVCVLGCGFAQRGEVIFAVRAIQGIGAAMTIPAALTMITTTFPQRGEQDRALGIFAGFGAMGSVSGLVLGGVISQLLSWRWVFWILAMVVLPLAALTFFIAPPDHPSSEMARAQREKGDDLHTRASLRTMDWLGLFTVTLALALLTYGLSAGPSRGWSSPGVLVPLIIGVVLLPVFLGVEVLLDRRLRNASPIITHPPSQYGSAKPTDGALVHPRSAGPADPYRMVREDTIQMDEPAAGKVEVDTINTAIAPRRAQPLIPPALWALPEFVPLFFIILSEYLFMNVVIYQESLVFQQVWGTTPLGAALRIIPFGITGFITTISSGLVTPHVSPRPILIVGQLLMMGSALLLTFAKTEDTYWRLVLPALILAALGVASGFVAANIALLRTPLRATPAQRARLPPDSTALIGAIFNADLQIGSTLGLAIATAVTTRVNSIGTGNGVADPTNYSGYRASYFFLLGLAAFEAILAAVALRGGWRARSGDSAPTTVEKLESGPGNIASGASDDNLKGRQHLHAHLGEEHHPNQDAHGISEQHRVVREARSYDMTQTIDGGNVNPSQAMAAAERMLRASEATLASPEGRRRRGDRGGLGGRAVDSSTTVDDWEAEVERRDEDVPPVPSLRG
ncbi:hypothetical protein HGRIS_011293 [Hohenbuehelia grisea]|uniref:Major facilitator superfamily (MFS) profile domain-containing protein n=1 Tax=Hohenbuehelia grisea TaxID=104357 RepID=A0ABR3JUN5_9AGAR